MPFYDQPGTHLSKQIYDTSLGVLTVAVRTRDTVSDTAALSLADAYQMRTGGSNRDKEMFGSTEDVGPRTTVDPVGRGAFRGSSGTGRPISVLASSSVSFAQARPAVAVSMVSLTC